MTLNSSPLFDGICERRRVNRELEAVVLKTLAGFMNLDGGTLLIGVADDRRIVGLEQDYKTLKKCDRDGFGQALMTSIATNLGGDVSYTVQMVFRSVENKDVCRVIVSPAHRPVYLEVGNSLKFVRADGRDHARAQRSGGG
jgi:predicted HTH transcriptional regulator